MWNPGFPFLEAVPAILKGYHRSFCIYSTHYRGTQDKPGLVLGLGPGGSCTGVAFRVARTEASDALDYLRERELVAYAYVEAVLPVDLRDGRIVDTTTFVADPSHRRYAGNLGVERSAEIIMGAVGCAGLNREYLIRTVRQLENHGVVDPPLHALLKEVSLRTGEIDAGDGI